MAEKEQEEKKRKTTGVRLDVELIALLKIGAIAKGITFEDYNNEILWGHIDIVNPKRKIPNQKKLDKNIN